MAANGGVAWRQYWLWRRAGEKKKVMAKMYQRKAIGGNNGVASAWRNGEKQ
jgi:hypothetical protein